MSSTDVLLLNFVHSLSVRISFPVERSDRIEGRKRRSLKVNLRSEIGIRVTHQLLRHAAVSLFEIFRDSTFFDNSIGCMRMSDVTRILDHVQQGDARAAEQLLPLVYDELR